VDVLHGERVTDSYRWLEEESSSQTRAWLAAQDRLWEAHAARLPGRDGFRKRAAELADIGMVSAPMWRGERRFFLRRSAGQEHPVLYTCLGDGAEEVLVDPTAIDPTGLTTLDAWQPDLEGRQLACQLSRHGTERAQLTILDVATGRLVDGPIDRCRYSPIGWLPGGEAFFYVRSIGESPYPQEVLLHRIGTPPDSDVPIMGSDDRPDEATTYGLGISADGRWLAISAAPGTAPRNNLWIADLCASVPSPSTPSSPENPDLRLVHSAAAGRAAFAVAQDGKMYIVTDVDAPGVRLCVADPERPAEWRELVPEDPEAVLVDFAILDACSTLIVGWLREGGSELAIHDLATGDRRGTVALPGEGSIGPLSTRSKNAHEVWFTYTDNVTPSSVWHYDYQTGTTDCWAAAPGIVALPQVPTRHITCTSPDGTPVRVTVLGDFSSGPRPTILYGYGGFGIPLTPSFAADSLAWVEAGGVLAIAHVRGGGERGMRSHRAGMLEHKQHVFDDFIAAAEELIASAITTPEQLGIWGESNGGLLVGAALTQRPGLFAAAVCLAPLLDMVRYEQYGLAAGWREEYGSISDAAQFRTLFAYSPYHHVHEQTPYPAVLFSLFGGDTRVHPMHARKMCAALQRASTSPGPILLRQEPDVGHTVRSADRAITLTADLLAFLAAHTGLHLIP
jgi:prolyl oligopeptidase